jgi:enoyl-CoA hydratase
MADAEILFEKRGAAGVVTLNRLAALNAVSHGMVRGFAEQLEEWESNPAVTRIVVTAAGGKAFSAGGDIRALTELGRSGRHDEALGFWRDEYRLNTRIKHYQKPFVSLIDGIVMGGGVGISVHGSHRVAGDRYLFAMPEVGIGFFPDVGATWFLPRLRGAFGAYLALTGERLKADEAVAAGIATHRVPSTRFPELLEGLTGTVSVDALLAAFADTVQPDPQRRHHAAIDRLFAFDSVEAILEALDRQATAGGAEAEFAGKTAATIRTKSPTSLKLALAQMRAGKNLDFAECMRVEFRIVSRIIHGHDFYEGVRAVIIDKDGKPQWQPAALAAVSAEVIAQHFASLGPDELVLP